MFEVRRFKEKPIVIIRAATAEELSNYENWKIKNTDKLTYNVCVNEDQLKTTIKINNEKRR